jgi:hypothetical protein
VRRRRARNVLDDSKAERAQIDAFEQVLARAQQHGRDRQVHLVDEPRPQVLADRRHAATQPHVRATSGVARLPERVLDPARDEVERRPAVHLQRPPRVMSEHEHLRVIRRVLTPPAAPALVRPRAAYGAEHVAAEDPRADVLEAAAGEVVVDARDARVGLAVQAPERTRRKHPPVQVHAVAAEGVLLVLVGSGAESVERDREGVDAQLAHGPQFPPLAISARRRASRSRISGVTLSPKSSIS